jgi:hypothetical protein
MSDIGPVLILAGGLSPERGLTETSTLPMAVASAGMRP